MAERGAGAVSGHGDGRELAAGGQSAAARFDRIVEDLRALRLHGLVELRRLRLSALGDAPAEVERQLRAAVDALGAGNLAVAAAYSFGLAQGTRDWPAQDRRRRAAEVYGVSVERFRKQQERIILEQVAEQLVALAPAEPDQRPEALADAAGPGADADRAAPWPQAGADEYDLEYPVAGRLPAVTVHVLPIELIRDVDIHVSPSNVYFETARIFGDTVSAGLRRAAARTDSAGRVTDDVVHRELTAWMAEHGGPGTALPPGTVAPTGVGALAERGIRRIYHTAVAMPVGSGDRYTVDEASVARAVHGVFAAASAERDRYEPPLSSICFPLIGAGRGGLDPARGIRLLWRALREELGRDPDWSVHLCVRHPDLALALIAHLTAQGARRRAADRSPLRSPLG